MKRYLLFVIPVLIASCASTNDAEKEALKQELALKDKELALQQREIELQRKSDSLRETNSKSLSDHFEEVKDAVFLIYTTDNINIAQGSAFVVNSNGTAISNYHIFENASKAIAVNAQGDRFIIDEIFDYSADDDYIIFKLSSQYPTTFTPVKIATEIPRIGDECFAVGNPQGLTQTLSKGIVSGYRLENQLIQTTAEITHGSSGGALFNQFGEVIGVTTSGVGEADLNFALNIRNIPINDYLLPIKPITQEKDNSYIATVKTVISSYYDTYKAGDYRKLETFFSNSVKRYFGLYNITPDDAIASAYEYDSKKGISIVRADIDWERFQVSQVSDGYYITFPLDYAISRNEKNKPTQFKINMTFELDYDYKITTIYENILARS